jgi:hypothetical protein
MTPFDFLVWDAFKNRLHGPTCSRVDGPFHQPQLLHPAGVGVSFYSVLLLQVEEWLERQATPDNFAVPAPDTGGIALPFHGGEPALALEARSATAAAGGSSTAPKARPALFWMVNGSR